MTPLLTVKVDTRGLEQAILEYSATTKKSAPEIINQRALNVARWAFEALPPQNPIQKSQQIKEYMDRVVVTKVRFSKSKRKFTARGAKHHLRVKHLIAQARRKKAGLKGLYGDEMRAASGKLAGMAQRSVGYLKSVFLPIFVGLNPVVKFKMPFAKTKNIPRWAHSAGSGKATPATEGWNVHAFLETNTGTSKAGQFAKIEEMQTAAVEFAVAKEENELMRHTTEKLRGDAKRYAKVE